MAVMSSSPLLPPPPAPADHWALFLDVDGTLLEFAATPDGVRVPAGLIDTLAEMHRHLQGALALVSGRPLDQIDALFAPLVLPAAGLHGLQRRDAHGAGGASPQTRAEVARPAALAALRIAAEAVAARFPGAVVEDKGATLALHWRGNARAQDDLRALAEAALARLPGYRAQPGDHVIELRPHGADKGAAIAAMLDALPFRDRMPVFVGDDHTDEHGFEVAVERGGLAILVGKRQPSMATHGLQDPAAVREWLTAAGSGHARNKG